MAPPARTNETKIVRAIDSQAPNFCKFLISDIITPLLSSIILVNLSSSLKSSMFGTERSNYSTLSFGKYNSGFFKSSSFIRT